MRMLHWMSDKTRQDMIMNDNIRESVGGNTYGIKDSGK